jgi:hypothetical protein
MPGNLSHSSGWAPLSWVSGGTKSQLSLRITFPGDRWSGWGWSLAQPPERAVLQSVTALTALLRLAMFLSVLPAIPTCPLAQQGAAQFYPSERQGKGQSPQGWPQQM